MSSAQNFGLNLSTGKLSFPVTLGTLSGPNGFGSTISLTYSTTDLVSQVTTWNEDAPTDIVGLGWSLEASSTIMRSGSGSWQDSFFLLIGNQSIPLLLTQSPLVSGDFNTLEFVTQSKTLYKITYDVSAETWTVIDADGNICVYGGIDTHPEAVDLGVRWVAQEDGEPAVWMGSSVQNSGQQRYALAWRLVEKTTPAGQCVTYTWSQIQQLVGTGASGDQPSGLYYTVANYLTGIQVQDGSSVVLNYGDKNTKEYPVFRWNAAQPGALAMGSSTTRENAFQDRISTKYLASLTFYDIHQYAQTQVNLNYGFLYDNFRNQLSGNNASDVDKVDKRLLLSFDMLTAGDQQILAPNTITDGQRVMPSQTFDYWGLWDDQLQDQIVNAKLLALSNQNISVAGITNYAGAKADRSYNALFGHLKTITSPQGSLLWYSYSDNSRTSTNWDLRYDTASDLSKPDDTSKTWSNPQPYWGDDNYVVMRWNGLDSQSNKYVSFQIYEWIGKWIQVQIYNSGSKAYTSSIECSVYDFADDNGNDLYTRVATGTGKFVVAYTNIKLGWPISILHRDAYTPGLWNVTWISVETCNNGILPTSFDGSGDIGNVQPLTYFQLNMGIGNNIMAVLDVISGYLHLFSLQNNEWVQEQPQQITPPAFTLTCPLSLYAYPGSYSSACVAGDDVFVLYGGHGNPPAGGGEPNVTPDTNSTLSYSLYHYDKTVDPASGASPWMSPNGIKGRLWCDGNNNPVYVVQGLNKANKETYICGLDSSVADGFIMAQVILNYAPADPGLTLMGRPFVITWDEQYETVNLQQILSPNNAGKYSPTDQGMVWGYNLQQTVFVNPGDLSGSLACSNLINIVTASEDDDNNGTLKYVTRFYGGRSIADDRGTPQNIGWYCHASTDSPSDASDSWVKMATFDTTVYTPDPSNHYSYQFNQLQPYGQDWVAQTQVAMGENCDVERIERIVREVIFFATLALRIAAFALTCGASSVASASIRTALRCLRLLIHVTIFAMNNPWTRRLERSLFEAALSARRVGDGGGQNYLVVGTNNKNTGEPSIYYKNWNTQSAAWSWVSADYYGFLKNISVPSFSFKDPTLDPNDSDLQIAKCLSTDVYRYGTSFAPFSYMSYLEHDVSSKAHDGVVRNFYADQVAFFRNGILSDLVSMPSFEADSTYVNSTYGTIYLPYTFFQKDDLTSSKNTTQFVDGGTNNFVMYAPWGGILAYQPQVYTKYYAKSGPSGVLDDVIAEGVTGYTSWEDADSSQDLPALPDVQYAVSMRLFMAQDQCVSGALSDFAVDKVSLDDGIQVYDVNMCYMGDNATYQGGWNSVVYNQVRVAAGASDYQTASTQNGWTEHYYYSGSAPSLNAGQELFPFDPATDQSNPLYDQMSVYTNAATNLNSLLGSCYAVRRVKNNPLDNPNWIVGIEMARQYTYCNALYQSHGVGTQQIQNTLTPLTLTFTAADNAAASYIQDNSVYTSSAQYAYFDLDGLSGENALSGFSTGLTLGNQTSSYHVAADGTPQTQYTTTSYTYGFQVPDYSQDFQQNNLWNPVVQTVTTQTSDASSSTLINTVATATVWTTGTNSHQDAYWYPFGTYTWCGSDDGTISSTIPWSAESVSDLSNAGADWQLSSYAYDMCNGLVTSSVTVSQAVGADFSGVRTKTAYDASATLPIAVITSCHLTESTQVDISDDTIIFTAFEPYEDLSRWSVSNSNGNALTATLPIDTSTCYVGSQSLSLQQGQFIVYASDAGLSYPADQCVLSFFCASSLAETGDAVQLWIRASQNGRYTDLLSKAYPLSTQDAYAWGYQQILLNFKDLASSCGVVGPYDLWIGFSWTGSGSSVGCLDGFSLIPLGGALTATVYDAVILLPVATLDGNGLTQRSIYDGRQSVIGKTYGRCETEALQSLSIQTYARDNLVPSEEILNMTGTVLAQEGGSYDDFRTDGQLMGWSGPGSVSGGEMSIPAGAFVQKTCPLAPSSSNFGVRLQIAQSTSVFDFSLAIASTNPQSTLSVSAQFNGSTCQIALTGTNIGEGETTTWNITPAPQQDISDWFLFVCQNIAYLYISDQPIFQIPFTLGREFVSTTITAQSKDLTLGYIVTIVNPSIVASFTDGAGRTRQMQSTADLGCPNFYGPGILISEQLYDLKGRNAFNTVTTAKRNTSATYQKIIFEDALVDNRDPATEQNQDFWSGGAMTGLITNWVDKSVFTGQDPDYAYSGSYYESDPTNRLDKATVPGATFDALSPYASQFCYGQYESLPDGTNSASVIRSLLDRVLGNLGTTDIESHYQINVSQMALNNTSHLTLIVVTEERGSAVAALSLDPEGFYLLATQTYQMGNTAGHNGQPVVRQTQIQLPNFYDTSGNIVSENTEGFQITTETSFLGKTTYVKSPDAGERVCYYDNTGLMRFSQNADQKEAGICLMYLYDDQRRLIGVNGVSLPTWTIGTLEAYMNGSEQPDQTRQIQAYTYDTTTGNINNSQGRLVQIDSWNILPTLAESGGTGVQEKLTYDDFGHVIAVDVGGGALEYGFSIQCTYTNLGQVETITYPAAFTQGNGTGVIYRYNTQGKIASVGRVNKDQSVNLTYYAQYRYDENDHVTGEDLASISLTRTYGYDVSGNLIRISDDKGYFSQALDYSLNGVYQDGNIQSALYAFGYGPDSAQSYTYTYAYDAFGRLTSAASDSASMIDWLVNPNGYDGSGNIYSVIKNGLSVTYTYSPGTNQLLQALTTYSDGSWSIARDVDGYTPSGLGIVGTCTYCLLVPRPMGITVGSDGSCISHTYNSRGECLQKSGKNFQVNYRRQGNRVIQEAVVYFGSGNEYLLSYVYGANGLIAVDVTQTSGANKGYDGTYFMMKDDLGSIRAIYNPANSTDPIVAYINYTPWGEVAPANSTAGVGDSSDNQLQNLFRYLYTGQEWDADIALYNYHARQYDPAVGRFLSPDPDHQFPSPYIYCGSNPVNGTDPTGQMEGDRAWMTEQIGLIINNNNSTIGDALAALSLRQKYLAIIKGKGRDAVCQDLTSWVAKIPQDGRNWDIPIGVPSYKRDPVGAVEEVLPGRYELALRNPCVPGISAEMRIVSDAGIPALRIYEGEVPFRLGAGSYRLVLGHSSVAQYVGVDAVAKMIASKVQLPDGGNIVLGICNGDGTATRIARVLANYYPNNVRIRFVPNGQNARSTEIGIFPGAVEGNHGTVIVPDDAMGVGGPRNTEIADTINGDEFAGLDSIPGNDGMANAAVTRFFGDV